MENPYPWKFGGQDEYGRQVFVQHHRSGHVGLHFLLRQVPYEAIKLCGQYLTGF
jgi:hypothetical protein